MAEPKVLTTPEDAAPLVEAWRALVSDVGASYFSLPDWVVSWWETYGRDRHGELAVWWDGPDRLGAVAGLVGFEQRVHPRLPGSVAAWGNLGSRPGSADHYAWPTRPSRADDVRGWLATRAAERPMVLTNLDADLAVPLLPRGRCIGRSPCPRVRIPSDGERLALSSGFRQHLRSWTRKLVADGVRFRWVAAGEVTDDLLDVLFDLHERRRGLTGGVSTFDNTRAPLLRALNWRSGPGRGPAAVIAERDGRVEGLLYGFVWDGAFSFYQSGWDPMWASLSLGTVLVDQGIRLAGLAGLHTWDFLRGTHEYKYRFGATDRVDETWLIPTGVTGRVLDARFRLKARIVSSQ